MGNDSNSISDTVTLPVGYEVDGVRYREVVLDELIGIDEHLVSSKKASKNPAKSTSLLLARCIQEIVGIVPRKKNPESLLDTSIIQKMYGADRDFLVAKIYELSGKGDIIMAGKCPRCESIYEEECELGSLVVETWPDDMPCEVPFTLDVGIPVVISGETVYHKEGVLGFITGKTQELAASISENAESLDAILCASIKRIGEQRTVDRHQLKKTKQRDREKLLSIIQYEFPGVRMWKEVECSCGREFEVFADMSAFFGGRRRTKKS